MDEGPLPGKVIVMLLAVILFAVLLWLGSGMFE